MSQLPSTKPRVWIALFLIAVALLAAAVFIFGKRRPPAADLASGELQQPNRTISNVIGPQLIASKTEAVGTTSRTNPPAAIQTNQPQTQVQRPTAGAQVQQLAAQLSNAALPLKERKRAARELAQACSDDSVLALKQALANAPASLQAAIAEALGICAHPEAKALLASLLQSQNQQVALGAVRGLGNSQSSEAAWTLVGLLNDASRSVAFRAQVADALGETQRPEALEALRRVAHQSGSDQAFSESVLGGIAKFPFDQTRSFFETYLQSPQVDVEHRVAALQALEQTSGEVGDLLIKYARDPDAEIRLAAARALVSGEERGSLGKPIVELLNESADQAVRANLYRALAFQSDWDLQSLWPGIQRETDAASRLAGLGLAADMTRRSQSPEMTAFFNEHVLPELKNAALGGADFETQMQAIIALRAAGTPEALAAVDQVAKLTKNPKIARVLNAKK